MEWTKEQFIEVLERIQNEPTPTASERRAFLREHSSLIAELGVSKSALAKAFFVSRQQIQKDCQRIARQPRLPQRPVVTVAVEPDVVVPPVQQPEEESSYAKGKRIERERRIAAAEAAVQAEKARQNPSRFMRPPSSVGCQGTPRGGH